MDGNENEIYEFGPFRLIPSERQLLKYGDPVSITPKSFELLVVLVKNAGRLLEKRELLDLVWPDSFVEEANLSVKMSEVRRVLGESATEPLYIETVPRSGYRFVAEVAKPEGIGPKPAVQLDARPKVPDVPIVDSRHSTPKTQPSKIRSVSVRSVAAVLAGIGLVILAIGAFDIFGLRSRLLAQPEPGDIRSIAVLPLANLSGDQSQEYFADGMTEAIITDLSEISSLKVIARPSVMQYKGGSKPLPDIGRELKVDAVVTGAVLRSADRVRISVQLIEVKSQHNLWTETYERSLSDVLAMQREVTRDIVSEIRVKLTPQAQLQFGKVHPVNPVAYDFYLQGKYHLHRQMNADNEAAIQALENAVAADPTFAAAMAELAQAYVWRLFLFAPDEPDLKQKAFVATEKALAMDPNLAVAHLARGRLLWTPANNFPHEKAIREYQRALELNPNLDEARNQLALVYNHIGAFDEALRELDRAVETNPSNSLAQFRIGETLLFQGKHEQALAALQSVPKDANASLVGHQIVWALLNMGRVDDAATTLRQFLADHPEDNRGLLTSIEAVLAADAGRIDEAELKIKAAIEKGRGFGHFHHTAYQIACAYARMGRSKEAVEFLESAAKEGFPCYPLFAMDNNLDRIRSDPRFTAFLADQKEQWEKFKTLLQSG